MKKIVFYQGLHICMGPHVNFNEKDLCNECSIASLKDMRHTHLLLSMFKQKEKESLLKKTVRHTQLHMALVFWHYKPNNEKARKNVINRVAIEWNALTAYTRNMDLKEYKKLLNC